MMYQVPETKDQRIKPKQRRIILDIEDRTPIDIPTRDLDTIAEEFEEILRKRYDMTITCIDVIQNYRP